jgi:protein phosphatase
MTLALRYAVRSDVGLLREGNEDSAYAGPHLLAVADGMGGHAAGEVASAATITSLAPLDGEHQGMDLVNALSDAVASANLRLQELILSDPAREGMGTTLTALLWSDGFAALCHIGDSRAYLLRNGQFIQITHDHTLVQSLVDEGKITEEDVATHPHRSLLLRALDGRTIAEPDLSTIETMPGDRFLLCSDGLSGVVTEQTLHQTLSSTWDPEKAALQLVELAIRGGGPDNITCIIADVLDTSTATAPPSRTPIMAGAAANGGPDLRPRQSSPATRAMRLTRTAPQPAVPDEPANGSGWGGDYRDGYTGTFTAAAFSGNGAGTGTGTGPRPAFDDSDTAVDKEPGGRRTPGHRAKRRSRYDDGDDDFTERRRRWPIVTTTLVLLVALLGGGAYGAWWYNQQQFYVGMQGKYVAIFRGVNQNVAGLSLSSLVSTTTLQVSQLGQTDQATLQQTISKDSLAAAQNLVDSLQTSVDGCKRQWQALVVWQQKNVAYQRSLAHNRAVPKHKVVAVNPGPQPSMPGTASCAPAAAFSIPASALPGGQSTASPSPAPTRATPSAAVKTSARPTARTSPTARKSP